MGLECVARNVLCKHEYADLTESQRLVAGIMTVPSISGPSGNILDTACHLRRATSAGEYISRTVTGGRSSE